MSPPPAAPTDAFQYLTVLVSIVLGLGLTQLLTGVGRLVQARSRVRAYWPALAWVALVLLIHVQTWWAMFEMRDYRGWTFPKFLLVLVHPGALFLMAALALPDVAEATSEQGGGPGVLDLRRHYYAQTRWFFGATAVVVLASLARPVALDGRFPLDADRVTQLVFLALALGAAWTRRARYHEAFAAAAAVILVAYDLALFTTLR